MKNAQIKSAFVSFARCAESDIVTALKNDSWPQYNLKTVRIFKSQILKIHRRF